MRAFNVVVVESGGRLAGTTPSYLARTTLIDEVVVVVVVVQCDVMTESARRAAATFKILRAIGIDLCFPAAQALVASCSLLPPRPSLHKQVHSSTTRSIVLEYVLECRYE